MGFLSQNSLYLDKIYAIIEQVIFVFHKADAAFIKEIDRVNAFFEAMAWRMEPPSSYGTFHILFVLIGFTVCTVAAWLLRGVGDRAIGRILFVLGLILAVSELFKQGLYYFVICDNSYHWGEFPFQMCSVPMYLCLIAPWLKQGRVKRGMYAVMALYNFPGGAVAFSEPSGMLLDYWYLTIHSLTWHMMLVFIGLLLLFSKSVGNRRSDYTVATVAFVVMCALAFVMNCIVQYGIGSYMNMFFVGPGNSPLIVFSWISEKLGWYINTPIYITVVCLGAYILFNGIYYANNKAFPFKENSKEV